MRFAQSYYAYGFWVIIALIIFFLWAHRKRSSIMRVFADERLLGELTGSVNFRRQALKSAIIITLLLLGVLALMRPQWGFQWREVKRKGLDILIAIDTSKSMLAADVKPNRLERSKLAVKDLIKKLEGDRIGLIAFSGSAFIQCPLTVDYGGFSLALNNLDVDTIPLGGTSISSAIKEAMKSYEGQDSKYKVLVIITDGEDHEGGLVAIAEKAKKDNIKIFCIGIGTKEGELIRVDGEGGSKTFLKDRDGNIIKSRLNEKVLRQIALTTGGTYVRSSGAEFGLDLIYEEKLSKMEKREIKAQMSKFYHERFQIPLAFALILLMAEPFISDKKRQ
ncbi:MAG: VWA domain-containing protein [Candidatus Omnitrophica bacterium]|nr:VWA domain-containing protein [Candidatus Omnitrophota bacterium]